MNEKVKDIVKISVIAVAIALLVIFGLQLLDSKKPTAVNQTNQTTGGIRLFDIATTNQTIDKKLQKKLDELCKTKETEKEMLKTINSLNKQIETDRQLTETMMSISKTLKMLNQRMESNNTLLYKNEIALNKLNKSLGE